MRWTQFKFAIVAFRVQSRTKKWLFFRARVHTNYKTEEKTKKLFVFVCDKDRKKWSCTRIFRFSVVLAFFSCTIRSGLSYEIGQPKKVQNKR